jgi:hypothetical protein
MSVTLDPENSEHLGCFDVSNDRRRLHNINVKDRHQIYTHLTRSDRGVSVRIAHHRNDSVRWHGRQLQKRQVGSTPRAKSLIRLHQPQTVCTFE